MANPKKDLSVGGIDLNFAFLAQLFMWGQSIIKIGAPLIEDLIAVFKSHNVESDRAMLLEVAADAQRRQEARQAKIDEAEG